MVCAVSSTMNKKVGWLLHGQEAILVPDFNTKCQCQILGEGIGFLPEYMAREAVADGLLVTRRINNLAFGVKIRHQNRLLPVQQPADLLINGVRGVLHHDVRVEAQLAFRDRFRDKRQRVFRRDGEYPADSANLRVINAAAATEVYNGVWDSIINNQANIAIGAPDTLLDGGGIDYTEIGAIRWVFAIAPEHPLAFVPEQSMPPPSRSVSGAPIAILAWLLMIESQTPL